MGDRTVSWGMWSSNGSGRKLQRSRKVVTNSNGEVIPASITPFYLKMMKRRTSKAGREVFLSFRGIDVRKIFSDYLYHKLRTDKIRAPGDDIDRYTRRCGYPRRAFSPRRVDVAPDVLAQLKGKRFVISFLYVFLLPFGSSLFGLSV